MERRMGNMKQNISLREAVKEYIGRGWEPIPIPQGRKDPPPKGWQDLHIGPQDIPKFFPTGGENVAVKLGKPSGGLVDVDLDDPQAVALAKEFLPTTNSIFGRPGNPKSHWLYICPGAESKAWIWGKGDRTKLVELRSTGHYTIFPPSTHPSGETIRWEREGDPAKVEPEDLDRCCGKLAAATVLVKAWPARGSRQDTALALAGGLLRAGWAEEEVAHFIAVVAREAGDEETRKRAETAFYTKKRLEEGGPATGWTRLSELIGEDVVRTVLEGLGIREEETPSPYLIREGRFYWVKPTRDGQVLVPLSNFTAKVERDIVKDDGLNQIHVFEISGKLADGRALPRIQVQAERFPSMSWVSQWGVRAIPSPGIAVKDHLRTAIQLESAGAKEEYIYTYIGWREIEGKSVYLHAGGAIGEDGILVELEAKELQHYLLPAALPQDLKPYLEASLDLLHLAKPEMTYPLWAAVWRAPVACILYPSFVPWIYGETGSYKSSIAALFLSHWGGPFTKDNLPTTWVTTENALERLIFLCRDALVVIDDYAPEREPREASALDNKAARIIRQVGNRAARGRMAPDTKLKESLVPNAFVVSTGEQLPLFTGSIAARIFPIKFEKEAVDLGKLTRAQAQAPMLPYVMRAYLEWLAPQMNDLKQTLPQSFEELRAEALVEGHGRIPEEIAHLQLGMDLGLKFFVEKGALTPEDADALKEEAWEVFISLGREHARILEEERPVAKFISTLEAIFMQRKGYLLDRETGEMPKDGGRWGWIGGEKGGNLLGWVDEDGIYLVPEAVWREVQEYLRASGGFPVRERTLRDLLIKEGLLLVGDEGRATRVVWIANSAKRVLHLHKARYLSYLSRKEETM
jgi:hypothetical protein